MDVLMQAEEEAAEPPLTGKIMELGALVVAGGLGLLDLLIVARAVGLVILQLPPEGVLTVSALLLFRFDSIITY
jgi:hypothetical protein